jgi:hypothetical protein
MLSGKKTLFLMGMFEFGDKDVEIFPYVIGDLVDGLCPIPNMSIRSALRVYPDDIDSFEKLKSFPHATPSDVAVLQTMSENSVKDAMADIIGEPFVPAD